MWEYGPAVHESGHRLVITTESRRYLRPLVTETLKRAPAIDGWEFYGYRVPEDYEMAKQSVEARTGGDISDIRVLATIGELNRVDLTFVSPRYSEDDEQAFNDVFVAVESLLGEEVLDRWIGVIEVAKFSSSEHTNAQPIESLKASVDFLISEFQAKLPHEPYHRITSDETEWMGWELEPHQADDFVGQEDLIVARSMLPDMWQNAHSPAPFDSIRFSRCDESFCYVKMDGLGAQYENQVEVKSEIEESLDAALRQADVGCVVSGGAGIRYGYIDVALVDVDHGVSIIRQNLRDANVHERSWVQFYDTDYEARWIGVWEESPQPPMPEFED